MMMQRFETEHLDRILDLKEHVAAGQRLTDAEQALLKQVFQEAQNSKPLVDRFPEYQPLYARVIHLYQAITRQALVNEQQPFGANAGAADQMRAANR
jgi:hypothetical protein